MKVINTNSTVITIGPYYPDAVMVPALMSKAEFDDVYELMINEFIVSDKVTPEQAIILDKFRTRLYDRVEWNNDSSF